MTIQNQDRYLFIKNLIAIKQDQVTRDSSQLLIVSAFFTGLIGFGLIFIECFHLFTIHLIQFLLIFNVISFLISFICGYYYKKQNKQFNKMYDALENHITDIDNLNLETDEELKRLFE